MSVNNANFINLIGRLGDNPVSRTMPNGQLATEFSLATKDDYKDRNGTKVERTQWHRVKAYGKPAEILDQYLERGSQVAVIGTLRYRKWVDQQNQKRTTAEIIVESFQFLGSSRRNSTYATESSLTSEPLDPRTASRRAKKTALADEAAMPDSDQDLPF